MGSVFGDRTTTPRRAYSKRQANYFKAKKTDRKVVKHELQMQLEFCKWLRKTVPGVNFRCDTGAGAFNSEYEKELHNKQQSAKGLPDIDIYAARRGYHGLMLELKVEGTKLKRVRDAKTLAVRKNGRGKIIERDYKIRKAGDWHSLHIERQANRIEELKAEGYCAGFVVGIEAAKKVVCWYFDLPYIEEPENATLF